MILRDFYVDDLITGGSDLNELRILKEDIEKILLNGGFELHKWNSNESSIIDGTNKETVEAVNFNEQVNTLDLIWNTKLDTFQYQINLKPHSSRLTKRIILSIVSQIFDPLGLVGPTTIQAKLLLQTLWRLKIGWDDPVPIELRSQWMPFREQLPCIFEIAIPRHAFGKEYVYGAARFLRCI